MLGFGYHCEGLEDIDSREGLGQRLEPSDVFFHLLTDAHEDFVFQIGRLIPRFQHLALDFGQFFCAIAFRIFQGSLAEEMIWDLAEIGIGHVEIVTVFFVVINFEIVDARMSPLLGLNFGNPSCSFPHDQAVLVQGLIKTGLNDIALGDGSLGIWVNGCADEGMEFWNGVQLANQEVEGWVANLLQDALDGRDIAKGLGQLQQVLGQGFSKGNSTGQAFDVIDPFEAFGHIAPLKEGVEENLNNLLPFYNPFLIHQGAVNPEPQEPHAHGCLGLI